MKVALKKEIARIIQNNIIMNTLTDQIKGHAILDSYLIRHGFKFDNFKNAEDYRGQITIATYLKDRIKIIISYRNALKSIICQYDKATIYQNSYIAKPVNSNKKDQQYLPSNRKLLAFIPILNDLELVLTDFFDEGCYNLKQFSILQDKM